jgi:protein SCO1/2
MRCVVILLVAVALAGCSRGREYELRGQILAVHGGRQEITIKHEDIRGFMPGMTMPFKVRDPRLLEGWAPGDLVTATLVVQDTDAFLSAIERTGHAPLTEPPPTASLAAIIAPGEEIPDVQVTDQSGATRRFSDWRGRVLAVTFIYTRCPVPNFCPLMDRNFATLQRALREDPVLRGRAHLVSVSFDPRFDTPTVLSAHAQKAGADPAAWSFVTGQQDAIDRFASAFGVSIIREDVPMTEIMHNLRTAVIDREGRLVRVFTGNEWTPEELIATMRRAGE